MHIASDALGFIINITLGTASKVQLVIKQNLTNEVLEVFAKLKALLPFKKGSKFENLGKISWVFQYVGMRSNIWECPLFQYTVMNLTVKVL